MLAFGIRYLTGFVAAAEPDELEAAEWPPHPGRIFMALAAAHFQTGAAPAERAALLWLEGADRGGEISAPVIFASDDTQRAVVKHYVPVNDKAGPSKAPLQSLPITRDRQERVFACAWLDEDSVYVQWLHLNPPEHHREALANLCTKVTRIGHSSSLVQMWLAGASEITLPKWVPDDERATIQLRIPGPGTLDHLEQQYNAEAVDHYTELKVDETETDLSVRGAAKKRLREQYGNRPPSRQRPRLSLYQGYARPRDGSERVAAGTVFSPHVLAFQLKARQGPRLNLDLLATLAVTGRWREAILSHTNDLPEPVRRVLSGHDADGGPAKEPHLAFLPLAFIGHEHADGHLLGMALVLPAHLCREQRREALRAIAQVRELKLGPLGAWQLEPVTAEQPPKALRPDTWTAYQDGATHWSTVTPIAFDRHPKTSDEARYREEVAASIADACVRIGLPKPRDVIVTHISALHGVPPSFAFPRLQRKDGSERRHTHAILVFGEPVCGPVLLGAGRYRAYGVCRPLAARS